ncbi:ArnT family glycosyltransferase [Kolteria novifilia]|uniref:ArnT family glycosyltransferase n=1 Tax=Kolteria novifilia TaxID=2527975 RepID=UPI003AF3E830
MSREQPEPNRHSRLTRFLIGATILVLLAEAYVVLTDPFPLLDPDESLYAVISHRMLTTGDWLTPIKQGKPFFDRPALGFWLLAGSEFLLGDHDAAYRLPGLLLGLVTVGAAWSIARQLLGRLAAAATAFVLATMTARVVISLAIGHDSLLVCLVTSTIAWGLAQRRAERHQLALAAATGLVMGLAILAKGLLGIVLPWLALGSWHLAARRWPRPIPLLIETSVALLVGGSWYALMHLEHPGYLHYFFIERHLLGFLSSGQRHGGKPAILYLPVLLIGAAPWIVLLGIRPNRGWRAGVLASWHDRRVRMALLWFGATIAFFALAGSRSPAYLLPAFIPLAILLGRALAGTLVTSYCQCQLDVTLRSLFVVIGLTAILVPAGAILGYGRPLPAAWWGVALLVGAGLVIWWRGCSLITSPWGEVGEQPDPGEGMIGTEGKEHLLGKNPLTPTPNPSPTGRGEQEAHSPTGRGEQEQSWWVKTHPTNETSDARHASWHLGAIAVGVAVFVAVANSLVLPEVAYRRSARSVVERLRTMDEFPQPVLWFNHVPPSARHYGKEITFRRVYYDDIQERPEVPTIFVSRDSRLGEVRPTPLLEGAREIDLGGKFHLFICGPEVLGSRVAEPRR